ncbi:hypothetical protein B0J12DRAFT_689593, partial [Macrophomina phaseolina]
LPLHLGLSAVTKDNPPMRGAQERLAAALRIMDDRLMLTQWLAGDDHTAPNIYSVFPLSTIRRFLPLATLKGYKGLLRWLRVVL